jgi:hypothetical protein
VSFTFSLFHRFCAYRLASNNIRPRYWHQCPPNHCVLKAPQRGRIHIIRRTTVWSLCGQPTQPPRVSLVALLVAALRAVRQWAKL